MNKTFIEDKIWFHKAKDGMRWWFHWGRTTWHYEGYLLKKANHNSVGIDLGGDENDCMIHFGIKGFFTFYFGVEGFFPRKLMKKLFNYTTRHYGISLFEEYISIDFHRDDMGYSEGWKGYHKMIDWKTILFGRQTYEKRDLGNERRYVEMPEGKYLATVNTFQSTWTRKRFIKPKTLIRYEVTPDIPIPEPGKGENGWDIDDDALYSSTLHANSIDEALKNVAESVMKTRIKRAGKDWVPAKGFSI